MKLRDKVSIVTGGGRGIGRAIGKALAAEGATVVLAARTEQEIEGVRNEILAASFQSMAVQTDITREEDVRRLVDRVVDCYGHIDILVNNAGVGFFRPVVDMPVSEFDAMWSVNMRGIFLASKQVLPHMIGQRSGVIVNIGSLAGKNGVKGGAGYAATKWALRGFASSLMLEVREYDVRIVTIFPGSVDTTFSSPHGWRKQIPQPEDIADTVVFALTAPPRTMISEIDVRPTHPPQARSTER